MQAVARLFFLASLLVYTMMGYGQEPDFIHFTAEDGLVSTPHNFHILQGSSGHLYIASAFGLSQFDGQQFTTYNETDGLTDAVIRLSESSDSIIWALTYTGLLYKVNNDSVLLYAHNDSIRKYIRRGHCWSFYFDRNHTLHLGTWHYGYIKVDSSGKVIRAMGQEQGFIGGGIIQPEPGAPYLSFRSIDKSNYDAMESITVFNDRLEKKYQFPVPSWNKKFRTVPGTNGQTLLANEREVLILGDTGILQRRNFGKDHGVTIAIVDSFGGIWVGTHNRGIYHYPQGDLNSPSRNHLMDRSIISSITNDRENGIWVATGTKGVYYFPKPHFLRHRNMKGTENTDLFTPFSFAGNDDTAYFLSRTSHLNIHTRDSSKHFSIQDQLKHKELWDRKTLHWDDKQQRLLLGILDGMVEVTREEKLNRITPEDNSAGIGIVIGFINSQYGDYSWILAGNALMKYQNGKYLEQSRSLPDAFDVVLEVGQDSLLFGGVLGLWSFGKKGFHFLGDSADRFKGRINQMTRHHDMFWINNRQKGFYLLDNQLHPIWHKEKKDFYRVESILTEEDTCWVVSQHALVKIVLGDSRVTSIEKIDITTAKSTLLIGLLKFGNQLIIGSEKGFYQIEKKWLKPNTVPPLISINSVEVHGKPQTLRSNYILQYDSNFIRIGYHGVSMRSLGQITYRTRLTGFNTEWEYSSQPTLQFTNLSPGDYTFEVDAQTIDGVWSDQPATLHFTVLPPIWATWWFRTAGVLALLGIIYLIFRLRVRTIQKRLTEKFDHEKQVSNLELKALRAQMNPHFTFNTMNAIQHYISQKNTEEAQNYLAKFAKLIRTILNHSEKEFVPLEDELEALKLYIELEALRFENNFTYRLTVDDTIEPDMVQVPPLLIQPFVENAIEHGLLHRKGKGELHIALQEMNRLLRCTITDNGIGRAASEALKEQKRQLHDSKGMSITQQRIELIQAKLDGIPNIKIADLIAEDGNVAGTQVTFNLPIK